MSDWVQACRLWKGLAATRKLQEAEGQYRHLAFSRALIAVPEPSSDGKPDDESGPTIYDAILDEVGLGALPPHYRKALLRQVNSTLEDRVGTQINAGLTDQQLAEFEQFMNVGDQEGARAWLASNAPDYQTITRRMLDELKDELRANAPAILAAAEESEADPDASTGS